VVLFSLPICQARVNFFQNFNMKTKRTPMKKTCIWFLIGLLSLASAAWSQAQTAGGTEKAPRRSGTAMAPGTKSK
jgi:hypothetical protein